MIPTHGPITFRAVHYVSVYLDMYFHCMFPFEQCLGLYEQTQSMPPASLPRPPFFCPSVDSSSSSFSSLAPLLCSGSSGNRSEGEAGIYFQVCMLICSQEARRRRRIILFLDFIWHLGPRATHAMSMGKQQRIPDVPDACFLRSSSIPLNLFSSTLFLVDPPCFLGRFDSSNLSHSPFLLLGPGGVSGGLSILAKLFCWWRPVLKLVNKESNSGQQQRCVAVFL
jgi:hypothetical protein